MPKKKGSNQGAFLEMVATPGHVVDPHPYDVTVGMNPIKKNIQEGIYKGHIPFIKHRVRWGAVFFQNYIEGFVRYQGDGTSPYFWSYFHCPDTLGQHFSRTRKYTGSY